MEHSISELLPWLFLADDEESVVVNKDSSLLAAWKFRGVDIEASQEDALETAAEQLDEALRRVADNDVAFWTIFDRHPVKAYPRGEFENEVCDYIDSVWEKSLEQQALFENTHYFAVSMQTRGGALSLGESVSEAMASGKNLPRAIVSALKGRIKGSSTIGFRNREELDLALRRFETSVCQVFRDAVPELGTSRLKGDDLLGFLKSTASANPAAPVSSHPSEYLDAYLSDTFIDNQLADYLVLEGVRKKYVGVFTLKNCPPGNVLQGLNPIMALPISLRVGVAWKSYKASEAVKYLDGARVFDELKGLNPRKMLRMVMSQQGTGEDDTPKTEVGIAAMDLREEVKRRRGFFGAMSATVLVYADSPEELELSMDTVARTLEQTRMVFLRERDGSLSGLCATIPGQLGQIVRWHFVEASNVTDAAPLISLDPGTPYHPFFSEGRDTPLPPQATFRTRYSTVQYFNYHYGQLGHTLLIGPSRNGKTMLQMFLEAQFQKYPNARIFNLDKDLSCKPATLMFDGVHVDLDPARGGGLKLNPIQRAREEHGRTWLVGWLDRLMASRGEPLSDKDIEIVYSALTRIADDPQARLSTLRTQLPEHLSIRLQNWCEGGAFGMYFDHVEDEFSLAKVTTTEVGSLLNAGLLDVVRAYADYAFYRIERFLMDRDLSDLGPTLIYFEEAGFLLEDPIFAGKARDYLMTLAKKNAFLVMTAQSPEAFILQPALGAAVRDNIASIIFMPNRLATRPELASTYKKAFGLNDTQLEIIAGARSKAEYCVYRPQTGDFRVIQAMFPLEIINCLRSDAASQAVLERHYRPEDPSWKDNYLNALLSA